MLVWGLFGLLGLIWGSSFLLIQIGVEAMNPLHVVMIRLGVAAMCMCTVMIVKRHKIPRNFHTLRALLIIGIFNTAVPFTLISFAEERIPSGLASVFQATAALFGLIFAHFVFIDERITPQKLVGIITGFLGVIILASRDFQGGEVLTTGLIGQMMMICASLFYGLMAVYSRKVIQTNIEPTIIAGISMLAAAFFEMIVLFGSAALFGTPTQTSANLSPNIVLAVVGLGFVNTFIAYLIFYRIVKAWGASRAVMVTYIVPVVGLFLGVIFRDEILDARILLGASLIFIGIGIVNAKYRAYWQKLRLAS